jgi:hypothetical protein
MFKKSSVHFWKSSTVFDHSGSGQITDVCAQVVSASGKQRAASASNRDSFMCGNALFDDDSTSRREAAVRAEASGSKRLRSTALP